MTVSFVAPLGLTGLLILTSERMSYRVALWTSAALILACLALIPSTADSSGSSHEDDGDGKSDGGRPPWMLGFTIFVLGAAGGLYTAFVNPYILIVLVKRGLDPGMASVLVSVLAVVRVIYVVALGRRAQGSEFKRFLLYEGLIGVSSIVVAFIINPWAGAVLIAVRTIGVAGSVFYEELFQAKLFPRRHLNSLFGLSQSGFLGGSTIGAGAAGWVFVTRGGGTLLFISGILTLVSAVGYIWVYERLLKPLLKTSPSV